MASLSKQREALRIAVFAYLAGAHYLTEVVEKSQALTVGGSTADAIEARQVMLEADFERLFESTQSLDMFVDILDEEDLYPYGSEWPREAIALLMGRVIAPKLSLGGEESDLRFRFKKGFKALLMELAEGIEGTKRHMSTLDHWMVLLLNTAFHAGMLAGARNAENSKLYFENLQEAEAEAEPWTHYPQISNLLDKQLRRETRRRTGLVSDLDL